jgi:hypothetical protein
MLMGILLPESVFPDMPDHKPLASAGDEAVTKLCEVSKAVGPPVVAAVLVGALLMEENHVHVEPGQAAPVTMVTPSNGPKPVGWPVGQTIDSNDVVLQARARRQREHWAAINSTMNFNNPALWMSE